MTTKGDAFVIASLLSKGDGPIDIEERGQLLRGTLLKFGLTDEQIDDFCNCMNDRAAELSGRPFVELVGCVAAQLEEYE